MKILIQNRQRHLPLDKPKIIKTAEQILTILGRNDAELSILFVGDKKMTELNSSYRGISKPTDVLSFEADLPLDHTESGKILGDIVINIPRAESQAIEYNHSFYDELKRLMIHGTLHLIGYDHVNTTYYRARKMKEKEREIFDATETMG